MRSDVGKAAALLAALASLAGAAPLAAQEARTGAAAFAIEAAGATAGSLLGFGVGYVMVEGCEDEDLLCGLENAAAAVAIGTVLSGVGAYVAGRLGDTEPSGLGAAVGAVAGAAAGVGVWHLLEEELNVVDSDVAAALSYTITQGVVTALGSRLFRALGR